MNFFIDNKWLFISNISWFFEICNKFYLIKKLIKLISIIYLGTAHFVKCAENQRQASDFDLDHSPTY